MLAAKRYVAVVAANLGLLARRYSMAFLIDAEIHRRLAPAFADSLQLDQRVRQGEESGGARKQLGLEVGSEPVAKHRDLQPVGDLAQLKYVPLRQELGFVDQNAVQFPLLELAGDRLEQIDALVISVGGCGKSDARTDFAGAGAVVVRRGPQHCLHAALTIV